MTRRQSYVTPARQTRLRITPRGLALVNLALALALAAAVGCLALAAASLATDAPPTCEGRTVVDAGPCAGVSR